MTRVLISAFAAVAAFWLLAVMAVDALEYEITGTCDGCLILHVASPGIAGGESK